MNLKMRVKFALTFLFVLPLCGKAQTRNIGINFSTDTDFTLVLIKAKKEHKAIFIDCFATWCGPCKQMDNDVYSDPKIAEFFNQNYISLKLQTDQTAKDPSSIIAQRNFAKAICDSNHITGLPTLLFYNENGKLIFMVDGYQDTSQFLKLGQDAIDIQYENWKSKYLAGNHSKQIVLYLMPEALLRNDKTFAHSLHNDFVTDVADPFTLNNIDIILRTIQRTSDKGYQLLIQDALKIDTVMKTPGWAENRAKTILKNEMTKNQLMKVGKNGDPDWDKVYQQMRKIDPATDQETLLSLKMQVASINNAWETWGKLLLDYYDAFYSTFDHNALFLMNNTLWYLFDHCDDPATLKRAANWSYKTITINGPTPSRLDTYANLLYKSGDNKQAILWQEKALALAQQNDPNLKHDNEFEQHLVAMKNHLPTWNAK